MDANNTFRPSAEIEKERQTWVTKAEQLAELRRTKPDEFTEDQGAELDLSIEAAERCIVEGKEARQHERLEQQKAFDSEPARPVIRTMPRSIPSDNNAGQFDYEKALNDWYRLKFGEPADYTPQAVARCQKAGLDTSKDSFKYHASWNNLNRKVRAKAKALKRTVLTTTGTGTGAEWQYETFSDKLTQYGVYESPFVNFISTDTVSGLSPRKYFILDNTAMISQPTGGSEASPTVAVTNMASNQLTLVPQEITSGYQEASYRETKAVTFSLQDAIAQNAAVSDIRYVEQQILNGTATPSSGVVTGFQGILSVAANALGGSNTIAAGSITDNTLETMLAQIPQKYVDDAMWVCGRDGASLLRQDLKDTLGRPLFDRFEEDDVKIKSLKGLPFYVSEYMPTSASGHEFLVLFVPHFYQVSTYSERRFDFLREKFHPLLVWCGISYWAGAWMGPTGTALYLKLT